MHGVVEAINLIEKVVKGREGMVDATQRYYDPITEERCLVGEAWHELGVSDAELELLVALPVEWLHTNALMPLDMTMGAVVVYRAAQRVQDGVKGRDRSWGAAFTAAIQAASRYIDLCPDSVIVSASRPLVGATV